MNSFRNRLLALIIGLVVVTQSVTLVAVLASTARNVRLRADEQLRAGGRVVQQYLQLRAGQLAGTVAVLAADFGFREAVAGGDSATILSAAINHASRIGADLVLLMDTRGRLLASNSSHASADAATVRRLLQSDDAAEQARFALLGGHLYQFFVAPVHAPETIGWVAMGFTVDDALAQRLGHLAGAQVSIMAPGEAGARHVAASTLRPADRSRQYLDYAFDLDRTSPPVQVLMQEPMDEVLAPYRAQRNTLAAISGIALLLAVGVSLLLGRSTTRPIGDLVRAARRIQAGAYDETVEVHGGEEFHSLAATFNVMQRDIADREARIRHDAWHDALTGLPNRAGAERHLEQLLEQQPPVPAALILFEAVNLGGINASLGHHVGDEAVREAARRLQQGSGAGNLSARLGAAQFLVIARDCSGAQAPLLAERLAGLLLADFRLSSISLKLEVNVGVCCAPEHGHTAAELLRHAHTALEDAGEERAPIVVYSAGRDAELRRRLTLASDLGTAIERGDLTLVYQPKTDLGSGEPRSFEALARWTHPQLGAVGPAEFVPIAEQTGGTRRLTSAVLASAIRQLAAWGRDGIDIDIAVNLSAPDILDPRLGEEILTALQAQAVPATRLLLEITESAVMRDPALAVRHMRLLRAAGVRFSLDDFGTGYSSLSQLGRLPLDELKIDRSLVQRAHDRREDLSIVRSTIELAHNLGLKVVAEGVETQQTHDLLRRLRCDLAQGYLISRPLPAAEVPGLLARLATAATMTGLAATPS